MLLQPNGEPPAGGGEEEEPDGPPSENAGSGDETGNEDRQSERSRSPRRHAAPDGGYRPGTQGDGLRCADDGGRGSDGSLREDAGECRARDLDDTEGWLDKAGICRGSESEFRTLLSLIPKEQKDNAMAVADARLRAKMVESQVGRDVNIGSERMSGEQRHGCSGFVAENGEAKGTKLMRPIATPCRGGSSMPGNGHTLIAPTVVSIADAIPCSHFDVQQQCLQVMSMETEGLLRCLEAGWHSFELRKELSGLQMRETTEMAIAICVELDSLDCVTLVELYTDGSAKNGSSGFAVVVIAHDRRPGRSASALVGFLSDAVDLDWTSAGYLGADLPDALQAEASAMLWAILWALAHRSRFPQAHFSFRFDSMIAGKAAEGRWKADSCRVVEKSRVVMLYCESRWGAGGFTWTHTAAHQGHPWNELADVIAGAVMSGITAARHPPATGLDVSIWDIDFRFANLMPPPP